MKSAIKFSARQVQQALAKVATPQRAVVSMWFFKTDPGQYGEGDRFRGVTVPGQRTIAKHFRTLPLPEVEKLLHSPWHEDRLTALIILVDQYKRAIPPEQTTLYQFYYKNRRYVNNWDLVDSSARYIMGPYLQQRSKAVLFRLVKSKNIWDRRIALLTSFYYINHGDPSVSLQLAEAVLHDTHDLIHKASGWMLREIGQRCSTEVEEVFLRKHYRTMPRTMLRYAIEKFPEAKRRRYLA